ncbi:hypothetical protein K1719_030752 [Acacia pycnantha]|nr:hypothetical protein K1719_030752 [Acacia pycnantha]
MIWHEQETIDRVVAWVRFLNLPTIHYDKKFLFHLGNAIGKAIRDDTPTAIRHVREACEDWLSLRKRKEKSATVNAEVSKESEVIEEEEVQEKESPWKEKKEDKPLNDITNKEKGSGRESSRNEVEQEQRRKGWVRIFAVTCWCQWQWRKCATK